MSNVSIAQVFKQGGFTNAAGTVNFLRDITSLVVRCDWEDQQIGGLNIANLEMVNTFEDTVDFQGGNWVYFALNGGTLSSSASAGAASVTVTGLGDPQKNLVQDSPFSRFSTLWGTSDSHWTFNAFWNTAAYSLPSFPGGTLQRLQSDGMGVSASTSYTLSVDVDMTSVTGGSVYINVRGTPGGAILSQIALTNGTPRKRYAISVASGANTMLYFDVECNSVTLTNTYAVIQVYNPQLELGAGSTNYVPNPGQSDILATDYLLISNGSNTDLMKVSAVTNSNPWTVSLSSAPGQGTSTTLNAYASGSTISRLQFSGFLKARNTRTTDYNGKYNLSIQGFSSRYGNVLCNADIVSEDCATSIYNLCSSYAPTLPEIIVSSGNFASANGYLATTQAQNGQVVKVLTDLIKTENSQNANVNYAFWVDPVRQAHHATLPGANTATPSGNAGDPGSAHATPTYTIDIKTPTSGSFYDAIGPIEATDMDLGNLVNTALVRGGQSSSTKKPIEIIVQDQTSQGAWGYWEGTLANPDVTDEAALAKWAAGQLCLSAYPRTTARTTFVSASTRLTCRDLLQIQGFSDGSVMQFNPARIKYSVDFHLGGVVTGSMDLAQARPDIGSIMSEGANEISIRNLTTKPATNLDSLYVVSGCGISFAGLVVTIATGVVSYNGTLYSIAQYSYTMGSNESEMFGAQVAGTSLGGALPTVVIMPSRSALSKIFANNLYSITRPATQGAAITLTANTNFIGVPLWRVTSQNGVITGQNDLRIIGGIGAINLKSSTYPAPTFTGTPTATGTVASSGFSEDVTVSGTFNNIPADALRILWLYRTHGAGAWTPWAETSIPGIPSPSASQTLSFTYQGLTNNGVYDFGAAYIPVRTDTGGAVGAIVSNYGAPSITVTNTNLQAMPSAIQSSGPTLTASSMSSRANRNGMIQSVSVSFTESDFTSAVPTWLQEILLVIRVNGDADGARQISIDPRLSITGSYTKAILITSGDTVDVGIYYQDNTGQTSAIVWPAAWSAQSDGNGPVWDPSNPSRFIIGRHEINIQNLQNRNLLKNGLFTQNGSSVLGSTFGWTLWQPSFLTEASSGLYYGGSGSSTNTYTAEQITATSGQSPGIYQIVNVKPGTTYSYATLNYNVAGASNKYSAVIVGSVAGPFTTTYNNPGSDTEPIGSRPAFYSHYSANWHAGKNTNTDSTYQFLSGTITIPSGVTQVAVMLWTNAVGGANTSYWGAAAFWEGAKYQDFIDGEPLPGGVNLDFHTVDGTTFGRVRQTELSTGTVKQLNDGTRTRTAANVAAIVDGSGNVPNSTAIKTNIPSILPFTTDGVMHLVSGTGATSTNVYIDNGTANTACHMYLPDNTSFTAAALSGSTLTAVATGNAYTTATTGANGIQFTGLTNGNLYYFMAAWNPVTALWTLAISPSPFTATQQRAMYADGGYVAFQATSSGTSWSAGGGTTTKNGCPEVHQLMMIRRAFGDIEYSEAGTLCVGDSVLDPDGDWNLVHSTGSDDAMIWETEFDTEIIRVDASHLFDRTGNGDWVNVKSLIPGDELQRYGGGRITVVRNECIGIGRFQHISCERMRYVLGKTVSHNAKLL